MRADFIIAQAMSEKFFLMPDTLSRFASFLESGMKIDFSENSLGKNAEKDKEDGRDTYLPINNSVLLQKIGNIAVINVDGAMYKKDMSGLCMSVASYQGIVSAINEAKKMYQEGEITELGFRVSTPGGSVYGLNALEDIIANLDMPTFTFYEDIGASAGIYAFTAPDEIYAAPMTALGSIGAVWEIVKSDDRITITSSRAPNKRPDLNTEEGIATLREELDKYEKRFYEVVAKNTGFTEEMIEKEFTSGGMIMSEKAAEIGFIKEVITWEKLIDRKVKKDESLATMPSSSEKIVNSKIGANMEYNEENFKLLTEQNKAFSARIATLETREKNLSAELEEKASALDTSNSKINELTEKLSGAVAMETVTARLDEAFVTGVASADVIKGMLKAETSEEASAVALAAKSNTEAIKQGEAGEPKKSGIMDFCKQHQGSIR